MPGNLVIRYCEVSWLRIHDMEHSQVMTPPTQVITNIEVDLGPRNRVTTFFRLLIVIPAVLIVALLSGGNWSGGFTTPYIVTLPVVFLLLFLGYYPKFLIILRGSIMVEMLVNWKITFLFKLNPWKYFYFLFPRIFSSIS